MIRLAAYLLAFTAAGSAQALTLADCDRTTHISHGGETAHVDLGEGRVMWRDWWSQEGTATDIVIVDCAPGAALKARTAEERMSDRAPFDKTEKALAIVAAQEEGARVFATLPRIAEELKPVARDIALTTLTEEPCACAAAYAELRGDKTEYKPENGD